MEQKNMPAKSEFLLYQSKDGKLRMETGWKTKPVVNPKATGRYFKPLWLISIST